MHPSFNTNQRYRDLTAFKDGAPIKVCEDRRLQAKLLMSLQKEEVGGLSQHFCVSCPVEVSDVYPMPHSSLIGWMKKKSTIRMLSLTIIRQLYKLSTT